MSEIFPQFIEQIPDSYNNSEQLIRLKKEIDSQQIIDFINNSENQNLLSRYYARESLSEQERASFKHLCVLVKLLLISGTEEPTIPVSDVQHFNLNRSEFISSEGEIASGVLPVFDSMFVHIPDSESLTCYYEDGSKVDINRARNSFGTFEFNDRLLQVNLDFSQKPISRMFEGPDGTQQIYVRVKDIQLLSGQKIDLINAFIPFSCLRTSVATQRYLRENHFNLENLEQITLNEFFSFDDQIKLSLIENFPSIFAPLIFNNYPNDNRIWSFLTELEMNAKDLRFLEYIPKDFFRTVNCDNSLSSFSNFWSQTKHYMLRNHQPSIFTSYGSSRIMNLLISNINKINENNQNKQIIAYILDNFLIKSEGRSRDILFLYKTKPALFELCKDYNLIKQNASQADDLEVLNLEYTYLNELIDYQNIPQEFRDYMLSLNSTNHLVDGLSSLEYQLQFLLTLARQFHLNQSLNIKLREWLMSSDRDKQEFAAKYFVGSGSETSQFSLEALRFILALNIGTLDYNYDDLISTELLNYLVSADILLSVVCSSLISYRFSNSKQQLLNYLKVRVEYFNSLAKEPVFLSQTTIYRYSYGDEAFGLLSDSSDSFNTRSLEILSKNSGVDPEIRLVGSEKTTNDWLSDLEVGSGDLTLIINTHGTSGFVSFTQNVTANVEDLNPNTIISMKPLANSLIKRYENNPEAQINLIFNSCVSDRNARIIMTYLETLSKTKPHLKKMKLRIFSSSYESSVNDSDNQKIYASSLKIGGDAWDLLASTTDQALSFRQLYATIDSIYLTLPQERYQKVSNVEKKFVTNLSVFDWQMWQQGHRELF